TLLFGFPLETVPLGERVALLDASIRTLGITTGGQAGGGPGTQNPGTGTPGTGTPGTGTPGTGTPGGSTGGTTGTTGDPQVVAVEKTSTGCSAGLSDPRGLLPFLALLLLVAGARRRHRKLRPTPIVL
ncbi:MAG: MYXO-CTERM sorting domain-containing protein, partial [Planctomycetota bacterium]